ncbi:transcriptional regulator with XRE-family HTH domain [Kibdelosporangium banguiense]|uniref:Transcriptional regulator with XRE-family HTH domain n=1 Tax=Kibdelosporangium banguiense TaxID=1365924 RepID=A0ABS4TGA3_9PSEU|nr:helix-turn-helix transcriptional regulator [Kibdelosporangium banguiense]MBP2323458.1 transcriptional regulator with XRE-family HTH domain [Kibdelosporangium banguiense]
MTSDYSPTVRRRRLDAELRRHREMSGRKIEEVAEYLGCRHPKISRIENGHGTIRPGDVRLMLDFYGVHGPEAERLIRLARESRVKGWWHGYGDVLPEWLATYVGLEAEASASHVYEGEVVTGLLQTRDYARAVTLATVIGMSEDGADRRVTLRMKRQDRLFDDRPVELWAVHSEAALRRPVGGDAVMRKQLHHLMELAELPHINVQVLPVSVGEHPGMAGPFTILKFREETDPDVVYLDTQVGGLYLEKDNEITDYTRIFDQLRRLAMDPEVTVGFIHKIVKEL